MAVQNVWPLNGVPVVLELEYDTGRWRCLPKHIVVDQLAGSVMNPDRGPAIG